MNKSKSLINTLSMIFILNICLGQIINPNLFNSPTQIFSQISAYGTSTESNSQKNAGMTASIEDKPKKNQNKDSSSKTYFTDAVIFHQIPSTFIVGEVFQIVGIANQSKINQISSYDPSYKQTYRITAAFVSKWTNQKLIFTQTFRRNQTQFNIQCYFMKPDSYFFGIFIGDSGTFSPRIFEVIAQNSEPQTIQTIPPAPKNFEYEIVDNQMYVIWEPQTKLTKIIFSQHFPKNISLEFIISNDIGKIKIPYAQLKQFSEVQTQIQLCHAYSHGITALQRASPFSMTLKKKINITAHHFRQVRSQYVQLSEYIPSMLPISSSLKIKGKANGQIYKQALVVQPNSEIVQATIKGPVKNGKFIERQQQFQLEQYVLNQGVYILQINHAKGFAVINIPIYAGNKYPLLPDYHDIFTMNRDINKKVKQLDVQQQRKYVLSLINQKRKYYGLDSLVLNMQLTNLAQEHSNDMAFHNYVSHTNLKGQKSRDRANNKGIFQPLGENIAYHQDLGYAQYRLTRSPAHLKNIIHPQWKSVGIGIKQARGMYYLTQQYSTFSSATISQ